MNKFAVFLRLLLHLFQTGSERYKRCMVLPALRECINSTENVAVLFYVTIWIYLMDSDLLPSFTTLSDYSYFKI